MSSDEASPLALKRVLLELNEQTESGARLRVAVAESLTAGHLQAQIASVSGASAYFAGGVTAYSVAEKARLLGVDRAEAEACDCVSESVALAMATGVSRLFEVPIGAATTGYAEAYAPRGITAPFAWWAVTLPAPLPRSSNDDASSSDVELHSGRVDIPADVVARGRVATQAFVAEHVVTQLVALLRARALAAKSSSNAPEPTAASP